MRRSLILFLAFALTVAFAIGCSSGGGGDVTLPTVERPAQRDSIGTHLWGTYQVIIDKNTQQGEIVQLRGAEQIINVLCFLEPPPFENMSIDWDSLVFDEPYIYVDVILKHPIPDPVFMGFDVRGVVFGPVLLNQDGMTPVMNPADFEGEAFGYIDGLLGAPNAWGQYDGVWGYKYFCDGLGKDDDLVTFFQSETNLADRGVFRDGSENWRHYDLSWEGQVEPLQFWVFNYAIYANYDWPIGEPPIDLDSFNITANCSEAFCFTATAVANTLYYDPVGMTGGGALTADIEIWDWQGAASQIVTIESIEAGVITQTASDADSAGTTSKSWIHTFTDVAGVPTTTGDLDILVTVTDPDVTFGQAWFMNLLGTGNDLYDVNVWCQWLWTVNVSEYIPSGGWSIKDTGPLPPTLPITNEKNFCVVANDLFGKQGIYYFTGDVGYDVSYYDMTYTTSTLKGSLNDPFFGNIGGLLRNVVDLGSIECPPMGAVVFCNRNTGPMTWNNYPADGPVWWCSPSDFPNLSNGYLYFNMAFVDLEYVFEDAGRIWGFWRNNTAGVADATYSLQSPYGAFQPDYGSYTGYFPVDHSSTGIDGQISELFVTRFGIDANTNPELLTAPCNMMWYYVEQDPGNPSVEVCGNASTYPYFQAKYTIDDDELEGLPIDVSCLNNYEADGWDDVVFNWACVLEDYEDGTWCVSWWEWDGTAMQLIERTDPIDGTPHNLDCDTENNEVHVWATDGGTTSFWIFEYN